MKELIERIVRRWRGPRWKTIAMSYEDARRVAGRKSVWMVEYLRARRTGDSLLSFYRREHFVAAALTARKP